MGKDGNTAVKGLAAQVVGSITEPFYGSHRNITFDNYFTDLDLAYKMLTNGLTIIGTVRKNKRFVPKEFLPHRNREKHSSMFGFTKKSYSCFLCAKKE